MMCAASGERVGRSHDSFARSAVYVRQWTTFCGRTQSQRAQPTIAANVANDDADDSFVSSLCALAQTEVARFSANARSLIFTKALLWATLLARLAMPIRVSVWSVARFGPFGSVRRVGSFRRALRSRSGAPLARRVASAAGSRLASRTQSLISAKRNRASPTSCGRAPIDSSRRAPRCAMGQKDDKLIRRSLARSLAPFASPAV